MELPATIRRVSADYKRLPTLLSPDTTFPSDSMGRSGTKVHAPLPIRVEVHDLITLIEASAVEWEGALRDVFTMPRPYWTKNRRTSVTEALAWTAGIIAAPPLVPSPFGGEVPGVVPEDVAEWIGRGAAILNGQCARLLSNLPRIERSSCPHCQAKTMFTDPVALVSRCVSCGLQLGAAA